LLRRLHTIVDRFAAETPDHVALEDDGTAWSYGELDRHVQDVARQLSTEPVGRPRSTVQSYIARPTPSRRDLTPKRGRQR
jgi:non-ribosomal peptide synthetase component E (peptide arylation enzyme)